MKEQMEEMDIEERDAEYARRVMREVQYMDGTTRDRSLIREQGELYDKSASQHADRDMDGEERGEENNGEESEAASDNTSSTSASASNRGKRTNLIWLLISGNILLLRGLTKYYGQMVIVAALFLLSIVVMFWSLHLDMQYNSLVRSVQLLRERSIRLEEVRFSRCSHSSIVEELERRGIELEDPTTPATVIEKRRGLW